MVSLPGRRWRRRSAASPRRDRRDPPLPAGTVEQLGPAHFDPLLRRPPQETPGRHQPPGPGRRRRRRPLAAARAGLLAVDELAEGIGAAVAATGANTAFNAGVAAGGALGGTIVATAGPALAFAAGASVAAAAACVAALTRRRLASPVGGPLPGVPPH